MEMYGGSQAMEDPGKEWAVPVGETGLEEPMWQLGIGGGGGGGPESYPERPEEPDCIYYLRTGFCGYGDRCRFNHPRDRTAAIGALRATGVEYPERHGQPICQYYMRTGMCKFGATCKYHHPKHGFGSSNPVTLNVYGYPLRQGENECSYYVKTGQCKFGVACKFNHPQPAGVQMPAPPHGPPPPGPLMGPAPGPTHAVYRGPPSRPVQASQQYGVIPGNWPLSRPAMLPGGSYIPGNYAPMLMPQGVIPVPGWTPYQAPVSPSPNTQPTVGAAPIYGMTQLSPSATTYTGPYLSVTSSAGPSSSTQKEHAFPERIGQPDCLHYLRTGDCKFGWSCKYHHPPEWKAPRTNFSLSPMGLPLRPGLPLCSHYAQNGVCQFGPSCKFDHPMRTSLTEMPVIPYPMGSTNATFAPSSDLRPDLHSGFSRKDAFSSAPAGSMISQSGPGPQTSVQQSSPSSTPSISRGGEARTSH